jgi:trehalose-6-phosphatase
LGGKAATVTRLLGEREWGAVLMFGDDHSDLDAFDVLAASPVRSVTFGVVSAEVEGVVERSDITVESPHEVAQILSALLLFTAAAENAPR